MGQEDERIDLILKELVRLGVARTGDFVGLSQSELKAVEAAQGQPLPSTYKNFLQRAGRGAGQFMEGTDFFYPALLNNRKEAEGHLEREGMGFQLAAEDIVIASHQGYSFLFMRRAEDQSDPPVYVFSDGMASPENVAKNFLDWLSETVSPSSLIATDA